MFSKQCCHSWMGPAAIQCVNIITTLVAMQREIQVGGGALVPLSKFFHFHAVFGKMFVAHLFLGWCPLWEILDPLLSCPKRWHCHTRVLNGNFALSREQITAKGLRSSRERGLD